MRTYATHKEIVQEAMKSSVSDQAAKIERNTNACMQTIAGLFPVSALCRKIDVTAGDDAWLPDNLAGIISVYDSNKVKIHERNAAYVNEDEDVVRYYKENVQATPSNSDLPFVSTGIISAGSNKVYCEDIANLDAASIDTTGMTLRIYNATHKDYYYKIADGSAVGAPPTEEPGNYSCFEIEGTHPYAEEGSEITILRDQASRIRFVDADEEEITSGTYTIHYWIYPNPLSLDTDIIPLAYPDVLELMTIRRIPESKDRRPVSKGEIDNALSIAQRREKISAMPAAPRGQQGTPFKFGPMSTSAYGIRGE